MPNSVMNIERRRVDVVRSFWEWALETRVPGTVVISGTCPWPSSCPAPGSGFSLPGLLPSSHFSPFLSSILGTTASLVSLQPEPPAPHPRPPWAKASCLPRASHPKPGPAAAAAPHRRILSPAFCTNTRLLSDGSLVLTCRQAFIVSLYLVYF